MGILLSKFRKEKTTEAILEQLEERIQQLEKYTLNTQEQKKRFVGGFLAFSIGIFVIAFCIFYFVYYPSTWSDRITYSIPILLFPLIIILLRHVFTWYFQRKLNKNSKRLTALRAEKKKILEAVMDKETYKVAVNLLARFGADKSFIPNRPTFPTIAPRNFNNRTLPSPGPIPGRVPSGINTRLSGLNNNNRIASPNQSSYVGTPRPSTITSSGSFSDNSFSGSAIRRAVDNTEINADAGTMVDGQQALRQRRTPFPIMNAEDRRGIFDRMMDMLMGDGPQDRFAMICKICHSHNGMALKEEFDYTTFRCAFCNSLNPARKARPIAPRLPVGTETALSGQNNNHAGSSSSSDSSSDTDENERRANQQTEETFNDNVSPDLLLQTTGAASLERDTIDGYGRGKREEVEPLEGMDVEVEEEDGFKRLIEVEEEDGFKRLIEEVQPSQIS